MLIGKNRIAPPFSAIGKVRLNLGDRFDGWRQAICRWLSATLISNYCACEVLAWKKISFKPKLGR